MNIVEMVKSAGVVGAGGAGFPTHMKLASSVELVLANGAECEPLLFSDQFVMLTVCEDVVNGLQLVMEATGAARGIICIKEKNKEVAERFGRLIERLPNVSLFLLGDFYPSGDEHILVFEATGRIVPESGIPLNVGVVVQNVATLANISKAVKGEAVTTRVVTVGGEIKDPGVHTIPIGTSISEVIARCGGPLVDDYAILLNGPMMGKLVDPTKEVITKTSGGVFLLPKDNPLVSRFLRPLSADIRLSRGACEQCRYCTDFCPRYLQGHSLQPHLVMRVINEARDPEASTVLNSFLCCECGVCDLFACPLMLSPRRFYRDFKKSLSSRGVRFSHPRMEYAPDTYREYRRVPKEKLVRKIGLSKYTGIPPFHHSAWQVEKVSIPLSMHLGAPGVPLVSVGDRVKKGEILAGIPDGKMGANVHSSISGTVTRISNFIEVAG